LKHTGYKTLVVAGGVGANKKLRADLEAELAKRNYRVFYPRHEYCTDNGAMVAFAGAQRIGSGQPAAAGVVANARWALDQLPVI
jgi:N6-L-threonylcarbamoyladenine synthase